MSRSAAVFLAFLVLAGAAAAQSHTAGWSFIGDANPASPYPVTIGHVDLRGTFTTILPLSRLAQYDHGQGGALEADDRAYVVAILSKVNAGKLFRVDRSGSLLQTIQVLGQGPQQGGGYTHDVIVDQDGDYITVVGPPTAAQKACLLRVKRSGAISTLFKGQNLGYATAVTTDIDTGNFLLLDNRTSVVYSIAPDGSTVTSLGTFTTRSPVAILNQITKHVASGDLFVGSWSVFGAVLYRMDAAGRSHTFLATGLYGAYGVHADRSSDPHPRLVVGSTSVNSGLFFVDLKTKAITTLYNSAVGFPLVYHKVFPDRDVATELTGSRRWAIRLHFAGEAGLPFTIALTLSGVRPGFFLPDGRRLCFNVDHLTRLSLDGSLAAVLKNSTGILDGTGRAAAALDLTGWPSLKGVRVWIQAVTHDPRASLGLRTVADPVVLVL